MVVSGVPDRINIHAENVADMAFAMLKAVAEKKDPSNAHDHIRIRIGKFSPWSVQYCGVSSALQR